MQHEPRIQKLSDDLEKLGLHPSHLPIGIMLDLSPMILLGDDEAGETIAHELGVEDYMQKPFESEELLAHVGQLLVKKPKE